MGGETFINNNGILLRFNKIAIKVYVQKVFLNVRQSFISSGHYVPQVFKNYLQPCRYAELCLKCNTTPNFDSETHR